MVRNVLSVMSMTIPLKTWLIVVGLFFSSVQELQNLADDEDRILELLRDLPQLDKIAQDRQDLFKENEQLAEENVAKKPLLEENKRLLLEKVSN